ncbi:MAG: DUF86 domain-containing protein, partial [Kiritimatiellaeota bacterium]|nr:DUF86 domain-containing protein [Kiritimatiellota bacterium]
SGEIWCMSDRSDELLVADIREAVDKITRYTTGMNEAEFAANDLTVDAVIRNIEVMGEAASKLSDDFVKTHADTPFRQMTALRNRLIHGYFGVSLPILWRVVQDDIPMLKKTLKF